MKNNQKCIRISDKTLEYIESFEGAGFNQKLENMVAYFMANEDSAKKRISGLEKEERRLRESIGRLSLMERNLTSIKRCLDEAKRISDKAPLEGQLRIV